MRHERHGRRCAAEILGRCACTNAVEVLGICERESRPGSCQQVSRGVFSFFCCIIGESCYMLVASWAYATRTASPVKFCCAERVAIEVVDVMRLQKVMGLRARLATSRCFKPLGNPPNAVQSLAKLDERTRRSAGASFWTLLGLLSYGCLV